MSRIWIVRDFAFALIIACLVAAVFNECAIAQEDAGTGGAAAVDLDPLTQARDDALRRALYGPWIAEVGDERVRLLLTEDGSYQLGETTGQWRLHAGTLALTANDQTATYQVQIDDSKLNLGSQSLPSMTFERDVSAQTYRGWFNDFSPGTVLGRLKRIAIILLGMTVALIVIGVLRSISRMLILSERGLLTRFYNRHKNRALTLHSLTLNLIKYVVYFTAFGMILNTIGVNYTTYLASLSVIGLAVGFGSQGLVQDMVTGFFVIFEGQYDVDDMVEISGQVGIVQELGIRMTRLRNYMGQTVVIPNRNIAIVSNFFKGAQHATVDVSIRAEDAREAAIVIQTTAEEVARQFSGVVLDRPRVEEPLRLATGETFLRLQMLIWPQQQWLIEQQLVPRIREMFLKRNLEIPGDRIAVFYQGRERLHPPRWAGKLRWPRKRHRIAQPANKAS